ncbi:MAG: YlbF family regulator [Clostridia bacterium]|nr:YlbF family regulator [Clostridia bacterium]
MDMIELAREIGRQIQKDEAYLNLKKAQEDSDNDTVLQELIGNFNLKRLAINNETAKEDKDNEKLIELNKELRVIYADIMRNENMTAYNNAKTEFDKKLARVMAIIQQSAQGEDPNTTDYVVSCSGDCSGCSGCH